MIPKVSKYYDNMTQPTIGKSLPEGLKIVVNSGLGGMIKDWRNLKIPEILLLTLIASTISGSVQKVEPEPPVYTYKVID